MLHGCAVFRFDELFMHKRSGSGDGSEQILRRNRLCEKVDRTEQKAFAHPLGIILLADDDCRNSVFRGTGQAQQLCRDEFRCAVDAEKNIELSAQHETNRVIEVRRVPADGIFGILQHRKKMIQMMGGVFAGICDQ